MRRPLGYVLAWTLATAVAITGSWVGLQPLLAAAAPELPTPLPASQLREASPAPPAEPPTPEPDPTPTGPPVTQPPPAPLEPVTSEWREAEDRPGYERVFVVRGGEAVFWVSRREVQVLSHTPNPGYEVDITRWSRSSLILTFQSEERTSRIWVMWRGGPYAEVSETV